MGITAAILTKRRIRYVAVFLGSSSDNSALAYIGMEEFVKGSMPEMSERADAGRRRPGMIRSAFAAQSGYSLNSSRSAAFPARLASVMDSK
jgi:hypothetical protein